MQIPVQEDSIRSLLCTPPAFVTKSLGTMNPSIYLLHPQKRGPFVAKHFDGVTMNNNKHNNKQNSKPMTIHHITLLLAMFACLPPLIFGHASAQDASTHKLSFSAQGIVNQFQNSADTTREVQYRIGLGGDARYYTPEGHGVALSGSYVHHSASILPSSKQDIINFDLKYSYRLSTHPNINKGLSFSVALDAGPSLSINQYTTYWLNNLLEENEEPIPANCMDQNVDDNEYEDVVCHQSGQIHGGFVFSVSPKLHLWGFDVGLEATARFLWGSGANTQQLSGALTLGSTFDL